MCHHIALWILAVTLLAMSFLFTKMMEPFVGGSRVNCPTRNMSYDLRGEAYMPPRINHLAWMNTDIRALHPEDCPARYLTSDIGI